MRRKTGWVRRTAASGMANASHASIAPQKCPSFLARLYPRSDWLILRGPPTAEALGQEILDHKAEIMPSRRLPVELTTARGRTGHRRIRPRLGRGE